MAMLPSPTAEATRAIDAVFAWVHEGGRKLEEEIAQVAAGRKTRRAPDIVHAGQLHGSK